MDINHYFAGKNRIALRLHPGAPPVHLPIAAPPNGFRTSKGPILRKSIESFYFAAKAHAYLLLSKIPNDDAGDAKKDLPTVSTWTLIRISPKIGAGLLTAWYPEVGTLVLAYAAQGVPFDDKWKAPFYLPESWDCYGIKSMTELFNTLHHSDMKKAKKQIKSFSKEKYPIRILVCGLGDGGALAALAAPLLALAYPSADVELVTYNEGYVTNEKFTELAKWTLSTRLYVATEGLADAYPKNLVPRMRLPGVHKIPGFPSGVRTLSLAATVLSLNWSYQTGPEIQTSGSGFCDEQFAVGSFWGSREYSQEVEFCAELLKGIQRNGDEMERVALSWAAALPLAGNPIFQQIPSPERGRLGWVLKSFSSLVPGRDPNYSLDELICRFVGCMLEHPGQMSEASYYGDVVPFQFLQGAGLSGLPAAFLSDSISGADVYVAWEEETGTLLFSFRGTEPYELQDWVTDFDFLQFRGEVFSDVDAGNPLWSSVDPEATELKRSAYVHRGFLAQFESLAGLPPFTLSDILQPISGSIRLARHVLEQLVRLNHRNSPPSRNLAGIAHKLTGGRTPLRVISTGHSLGGALATLGAVHAALTWPEASISCFTFGSPSVGSSQFVKIFEQLVGRRIRAVHGRDIVPSVPPDFLRFQHVAPAVWLHPGQMPRLEVFTTGFERPIGKRGIIDHMMRNYNATLEAAIAELHHVTPAIDENEDVSEI